MNPITLLALSSCLLASLHAQAPGDTPENLPMPDGNAADMSKPVQVFILMGQSNMLGFGNVASLAGVVQNKQRFTHLMNGAGSWTTRKDVRNVRVMHANGSMKTFNNEWLTVSGKNFGPEIGFGQIMGHVLDAPVLVLKSCIGNRALGWDLLPPGSVSYQHNGKTVPGYQGSRDPSKRPKGSWYAGKQYDDDTDCVRKVLSNIGKYYPGAKRYEIAGFVWWQGHKDQKAEWATRYEQNFVQLIKSLRKDFKAPGAPFVCATIGFGGKGMRGDTLTVAEAQLAVSNPRKHPEFKGNVKTVDARPFWRGGGAHYGGNPETYMEVGNGLGWAMAELLENAVPGGAVRRIVDENKLDGALRTAFKALVGDKFAQAEKSLRPYVSEDSGKDREQVGYARKLDEYLTSLVSDAVDGMQRIKDSGDVCLLKAALAKSDKKFLGVAAYDDKRKQWATDLNTPAAIAELALGAKFYAIVAKKKKMKTASYFGLVDKFKQENPESFYARKADGELRAVEALVEKSIAEIRALGKPGEVYAKFTLIEAAKARFARIPAFAEANAEWVREFKQPATKREYVAGKTYAKLFADRDSWKAKFQKIDAKNSKMRSKRSKAKAIEKSKQQYMRKLKSIAGKLKKLADAYGDTFHGKCAKLALDSYIHSGRETLVNPLAGDGK